ncbi:hypothetical protein JTE90_005625 [Oedothorax gibbosus]|uniref:N-acetyltransferase domain-containing protein n=1 Tax=Oedothorax gibbosus TaxID=931172 RepID=A0AAV6UGX8_9ARAC|nr:hypothetical protein JTE90_005625 [Oedothorax gibbosus]
MDAVVRKMRWEDVPQVVDMWRETGLAEGTHTLHTWYRFDPDGFWVVATEEDEILGSCAVINLNPRLSFVGLYAVKGTHRGRGLGPLVWKRAMERVGRRNAGLNSVPKHLRTYRDVAGFGNVASWATRICGGVPVFGGRPEEPEGVQIVQIRATLLPGLINYDASIHGYDRSKIVTLTTSEDDSYSLAATRNGTGRVCGYGSIRRCVQGPLLVGPLYADRKDVARVLLHHLVEGYPGGGGLSETVTIAVISCNSEAVGMVEGLGLKVTGEEVPRCYTKEQVHADFGRVFGQHALNFSPF